MRLISVRLKKNIRTSAARAGLSVSAYIRWAIAAMQRLEQLGGDTASPDPALHSRAKAETRPPAHRRGRRLS
jgi:hypothetical protein